MPIAKSSPPLRVDALVKRFGEMTAVDGITLELRSGECLGLGGPNGAGKSTLIRSIVGRVIPDAGTISVFGAQADSMSAHTALGWVPQELALYPRLTCRENLQSFGRYHGLGGVPLDQAVARCLGTPGAAVLKVSPDQNPLGAWWVKTEIDRASSGKLRGRTIAIKDNVFVAGVPLMNGASILEGYVPPLDATIVTRILDAGTNRRQVRLRGVLFLRGKSYRSVWSCAQSASPRLLRRRLFIGKRSAGRCRRGGHGHRL